MENKDKPITPIYARNNELFDEKDESYLFQSKALLGLTKREYFAGLAMLGLLSADAKYNEPTNYRKSLSQDAIAHADELLKQLEK